jgi:hypothetical protein
VDPGTSHLERLEAAQRQLLVLEGEIDHLHQAERARAAELERDVGKVGLPEAVLNKPGPGRAGVGGHAGPPAARGPDVAGSKSLGSAVDLPGLHASLHERSLHDRSPHGGARTTWGSVDSLARAIP